MLNWSLVEVQEEVDGRVEDQEIAEHDAADEQHRHHQQERERDAALGGAEGRQHERVQLVEDDRQRHQQRRVGADGQRRHERLRHAQRDRMPVVRQRVVQEVEDAVVLPEAERVRDEERRDRDDDPRTELIEVLDERQVLVMLG